MNLTSLSSPFSLLLPPRTHAFFTKPQPHRRILTLVTCISNEKEEEDYSKKNNNNHLNKLLQLSVTLTVLSPALTATAAPVKKSKKTKRPEPISPEELESWSQDLPTVTSRIPYTDLITLQQQNKINHIIKLPSVQLKRRPHPVLVVLDDSTVVRTTLPAASRDDNFWKAWDELNLTSLCVNTYRPPMKFSGIPTPYLVVWGSAPFSSFLDWGKRELMKLNPKPMPKPKSILELEEMRRRLVDEKREEIERDKQEREMMERQLKAEIKMEERRRRREEMKKKHQRSLQLAQQKMSNPDLFWYKLAENQNVSTVIGSLFFFMFYRTVVLGYKKKKKDYEDRVKLERAEAEERRKMRQLEREMLGMEYSEEEEGAEVQGDESEQNDYLKTAKKFMQSGAKVRRRVNGRLPQYMEDVHDVKFSEVAGLGKIREELEEVVKFFTLGEMYRRRGVKIPGGILLCGSPGVGKTLLAKAVASEAGVNFFSISASQFVEIYVGVGASRVRALYQEAKENAPSVVFIDEIDAVGRERGLVKGSGGQERDATLNQLLVCLDGFEGKGNVITIAATNRPDILDPALVRPGRFDRKIYIPKPSSKGRVEILKVHARKKPVANDIDYEAVAAVTTGMVGAELANVFEVAALNIIRDGRTEITTDDLIQAVDMQERGALEKKDRSLEMWKRLALNEASVAVVAVNFPDIHDIQFITIEPRAGERLGYVRMNMDSTKFKTGMMSRQTLLDYITLQLAPRAADEIWYGEDQLSTIWAKSANRAREAARVYALYGLSEKHYGVSDFLVPDRIKTIDLEALTILNNCYERAKEIVQRNRMLLEAVVDELVQKKSLTKEEFFNLVKEKGHLEPLRPSIIDIRNAKRKQFQEMMAQKLELTS